MMRTPVLAAALTGAVVLSACTSTVSGHGVSAVGGGQRSAASAGTSAAPGSGTPVGTNGARTGPQLASAARAAMVSATAFHMKGSGRDGEATIAFDIHYGATSSDGSMTVGGAKVRLRYASGQVYLNGTEQFWRQVAGAGTSADDQAKIALLRDKWVRLPADTPGLSQIGQFAIRTKFLERAASFPDHSTYARGPNKTIRGVSAVSFVATEDDSVVYVPASGTPYPLRIEDHSDNPGSFDLSEWNVPFTAPVPSPDQIVELPR